jgi:ABC-2 type transport system ATP-binding protein
MKVRARKGEKIRGGGHDQGMIEVEGLVKRYGERAAVDGISFSVSQGELFGLLGPNGAGKTTTLSILATLLPFDAGRVTLGGHALPREAERLKPLIGLVPQDLALYPPLSAWENLAFFGRIYGLRGATLRERIREALAVVGLLDRAKDAVKTYSGGMKRRLNLAAGLLHRPQILFLDEPTVGVDPQSRNFIFEHVEGLREQGMTIIYTTHYMEEAERLCDRVAIMDQGRILALDAPEGLIGLLGGGVVYLGVPPAHLPELAPAVQKLSHVRAVSLGDDRLKIETSEAREALLELIGLARARDIPILSLEVLEPNLESVFLHLTGKHLRD